MKEPGKDNDASESSDESTENIFDNLASEFADYVKELCRLVIVREDNSKTDANSLQEEEEVSNNGGKTVKKPADGKKECSDTNIKSAGVRDSSSVDNEIKISDLGNRVFGPRNSKNTSKKVMVPNVRTVAGKSRKRSNVVNFSNSKKATETLNTSCHGAEEMACTSNIEYSDYISEAPTNNSDKDTNASLDCNSLTSTTDFQVSDSDSSIIPLYLRISEKYLGTSSTRMLTEENLRRLCSTVNQGSSEDLLNCNSETLTNDANRPQNSTELSSSFRTTDDDLDNQKLEVESSEDPKTVLDNTSPNSNPSSGEILRALCRSLESGNSGLNISNSDYEIRHSILNASDTDRVADPENESFEVLRTKFRNLVKNFDEFQGASINTFEDLIEDFSDMAPTIDDQEATFHSDEKMKREVPTKTTNVEEECGSLNTPICSRSPASNSSQLNVLAVSDDSECWNPDFTFSDGFEESCHADLMFTNSDNESKSDKVPSNALNVQKELQNLSNAEFQDLGQEEIIAAEAFSKIELTLDNDLETSVSLPETKENESTTDSTIAEDQCDRLEPFVYSKDTYNTAEFQNISEQVNTTEIFSNMELTSDNDLETSISSKRKEISANSQNTTDEGDQFEALLCSENGDVTKWVQYLSQNETNTEASSKKEKLDIIASFPFFHSLRQKEINTEAFSNKELTSDDGLVTSVSLPETVAKQATDDSTFDDNFCDRLASLAYFNDQDTSSEFKNVSEEVATVGEFSNIKLTSDDDKETSVSSHEAKGNEISAYSKNTKDECDRLEALIRSDTNTGWIADFQGKGQEVIDTRTLSNMEQTSYYGPITPNCSHDRIINNAVIFQLDLQHASAYSEDLLLSGNVLDYNSHSFLLSKIDEELMLCRLPLDELKKLEELRNLLIIAPQNTMNFLFSFTQKQDTALEASSEMNPIFSLGNEHSKLVGSHRAIENEMSLNSIQTDNRNRQTVALSQLEHLDYLTKGHSIEDESPSASDSAEGSSTDADEERRYTDYWNNNTKRLNADLSRLRLQEYLIKNDSSPSRTPKLSIGDKPSSTFDSASKDAERYAEDESRKTTEMNPGLTINSDRKISIDRPETEDSDSDTLDDIFKRVIKCHSIKKFPFESPNTERTLMISNDQVKKNICSTIARHEHGNILEAISNADSDSVVVLDVTDSFSQNSSIICDGLIKEYLDISAKVDLLLVKRIKYLSTEEWDIRMCNVLNLDDELGYLNAKLITTMNDLVKQFREIEKNIGQSTTGSQDLYHMGILEIRLQLVTILLDFICDKQLDLENYENTLRLEQ